MARQQAMIWCRLPKGQLKITKFSNIGTYFSVCYMAASIRRATWIGHCPVSVLCCLPPGALHFKISGEVIRRMVKYSGEECVHRVFSDKRFQYLFRCVRILKYFQLTFTWSNWFIDIVHHCNFSAILPSCSSGWMRKEIFFTFFCSWAPEKISNWEVAYLMVRLPVGNRYCVPMAVILHGWRPRIEERPGPPFQYKDCFSRYGDSYVKDKTVRRPSYL